MVQLSTEGVFELEDFAGCTVVCRDPQETEEALIASCRQAGVGVADPAAFDERVAGEAHLIRQRGVTLKGPKEVKEIKTQSGLTDPQDAVQLSKTAEAFAHAPVSTTEYEKEQGMKVERLKALVASGNYKMDRKMVENIAERITNMLI